MYNVKGFRSARPRTIAEALNPLRPDLVLVTECGTRRRLRAMGRAMGMEMVHGPLPPWLRRVRNALLIRPPLACEGHELRRFGNAQRFYPRGVLDVRVGDRRQVIRVMVTHLGLRNGERRRHARELVGVLGTAPERLLLGGDLNEGPDGPAVADLTRHLLDAWSLAGEGDGTTFPARDPAARIDYLLVSNGWRVKHASVGAEGLVALSDHLPVIVDAAL